MPLTLLIFLKTAVNILGNTFVRFLAESDRNLSHLFIQYEATASSWLA